MPVKYLYVFFVVLCVGTGVWILKNTPMKKPAVLAEHRKEPSQGWLSSVKASIEASEYQLKHRQDGNGWEFSNRAQGVRVHVDMQARVSVVLRGEEKTQEGFWLRTHSVGRVGVAYAQHTPEVLEGACVPEMALDVQGGCIRRAEIWNKGWMEWWKNTPEGIEQGWKVEERPEGEGALYVDVQIGGAQVDVSPNQSAAFVTFGDKVMQYGALVAWDARGRELPMWLEKSAQGMRVWVDDADAVYPVVLDPLLSTVSTQLESNQAFAFLGVSVSSAGDVNGDGYGDVVVGAHYYDNGETNEGAAFVYLGSSSGLSNTVSCQLEGNQTNVYFGWSVSSAGDVNGDGYGDVVVGAYEYTNGQSYEGAAFVYHGSSSGLSNTVSRQLEGNQASASFGWSVSSGGDVNGDGYSDVVVGAYGYDNGQTDEGVAFVYHGSSSGLSNTVSCQLEGNQVGVNFGWSVSSAGDVNGDGYSDVVVGAYRYYNGQSDEGAAFVYHGSSSGLLNTVSRQWESNQGSARFGRSVSSAGDVNGDGYGDVVVGAYEYTNGQSYEGAAFVYHGSSSGLSNTVFRQLEGNQVSAAFGYSVSSAGDVNGDGYGDVVVGARLYDNGQSDEGAVFVYHGSSSGVSNVVSRQVESNQANAWFGTSVSSAGDVNGDGYSDVVVGAYQYYNGQSDEGAAFVYHGSSSGLSISVSRQLEGNQADAQFGYSVSSAADINGDGYGDVVVGANQYENGENYEGAAFVYHGSLLGLSNTVSRQLESNQTSARFGWSVSSAGDVNGDGYGDVLVGAYAYDNGHTDEGAAFVYHGSSSGLSGAVFRQLEINQAGAQFGYSVSSAGDVNGDGYGDVVVGANLYDNPEANEGGVFVYHGSSSGLSGTVSQQWESNQVAAQYGISVSSAGDVNGDGYGDVVVGAHAYDNPEINEGVVFVYHGSSSGVSNTVSRQLEINQAEALFAWPVSSAGDVNGDGYGDVVVGARLYDNGMTDEGGVFVYHGSSSGLSNTVSGQLEINQAGAQFGVSVSSAGDVNGDGYGDVVVGAHFYDNSEVNEGGVFVYHGSSSGVLGALFGQLEINQAGAQFGRSVSSAGDVNGDGYGDVVVGAYYYDNGQVDEGAAFVYLGNADDSGGSTPVSQGIGARRVNSSVPVSAWGKSESSGAFDVVALTARPPSGRAGVKLQVETKAYNAAFDGSTNLTTASTYTDSGIAGASLRLNITGLSSTVPVKWRARILYDPTDGVLQKSSPWFNGTVVRASSSNTAPALTSVSTLTGATEDTSYSITYAALLAASNAADAENNTLVFRIESVSTGTLTLSGSAVVAGTTTLGSGQTLVWTPAANASGVLSVFTVKVYDGNSYSSSAVQVSVDVAAVNDAPSATNLSAAETYTEDTALNLIDMMVSDVDSSTVTATLTLSSTSVGGLSVGTSGAVTSTYNAGTGEWRASGALSDVNTLLAGVSFVPASNYNANFTLATSVSDGVASAVTGSKAFTGEAVNDAPSATNLSASETYTEDTTLNLADIVVSDVDSSTVTATLTLSSTSVGSLSVGTSGAVTSVYSGGVWTASGAVADVNTLLAGVSFVPALNYNGNFTLATSISDGVASAVTGNKAFTGVAVNDAPVAGDDSAEVDEGDSVNVAVLSNDSDVETTSFVPVIEEEPAHGSVVVESNGSITYTHDGGESTNDSFTYSIADGEGLGAEATVSVTVNPVNDAPSLSSITTLAAGSEDMPYNITYASLLAASNAADAEGNMLVFRIQSVSTGSLTLLGDAVTPGTTTLSTGQTLVWTPSLNSNGTLLAFTVKVYDGNSYSSSAVQVSVDVAAVNDAPVAVDDDASVAEGSFVHVSVLANDSDVENSALTVEIVDNPSHGTLDVDTEGVVTYTHDGSETSSDSFTYTVTDGVLTSNIAEVSLNVVFGNDAPTMTAVSTFNGGLEDTAYNIAYASLLDASNASDVENDVLAFRVEEVVSGTLLHEGVSAEEGVTLLSASESLQWTPPLNQHGLLEAFRVRVWDGLLASEDAVSVFVQVASVNDTPAALDDNAETDEGGVVDVSVLANDSDVEGSMFTPVLLQQPAHGSAAVLPNGSLRYTHNGGESTSDSFTYSIQDEGSLSAQGTVRITVTPVNDAPSMTAVAVLQGGEEDVPYAVSYAALNAASDAQDSDNATVFFALESVTSGTLTVNGVAVMPGVLLEPSGTWTWLPNANAKGTLQAFSVKAWDGEAFSASAVQVSVRVASVNDAPVLVSIPTLTDGTEDTPYAFTHALLAEKGNPTDVDGNTLAFVLVEKVSGTLTLNETPVEPNSVLLRTDTWQWKPDADAYGETVAFKVKVTDGVAYSSTPVEVRVVLASVADAPRVADTAVTLAGAEEDTVYAVSHAALLAAAGALEVDGSSVTWILQAEPAGVLTLNGTRVHSGDVLQQGQAWEWMPPVNVSGDVEAFKIKASDGVLVSEEVVVFVSTQAYNDAPVAQQDTLVLPRGFARAVDVLDNDTDPDSTTLAVEITQQPLYGTTLVQDDNTVLYTHDNSDHTEDMFMYRISDGQLWSEAVSVLVSVAPNQAPVFTQATTLERGVEDTPYTFTYEDLLAASNLSDVENQTCQFQFETAVGGVEVLRAGESVTWTPPLNDYGTLEITKVKAFDGYDASATWVPLTVLVEGVNDMPAVNPVASQTYQHPSTHTLDIEVDDVEDTVEDLQVVGIDTGFDQSTAKVYVDSDGHTLTLETLGFSGTTTVRVVVTDTLGGFVETFFNVTVTCEYDVNNDGVCGDRVVVEDGNANNGTSGDGSSNTPTSSVGNTVNTDTAPRKPSSCGGCAGVDSSWVVLWVWGVGMRRKKKTIGNNLKR